MKSGLPSVASLYVSGIADKLFPERYQGIFLRSPYDLDILYYYQICTGILLLTFCISSNSVSSKNLVKTFAEVLA